MNTLCNIFLKNLFGCIFLFGGIVLGIYVGFWLMFVGGIVQIIDSIKYDTNALGIALGFIRISFSGIIGWLIGILSTITGVALLE